MGGSYSSASSDSESGTLTSSSSSYDDGIRYSQVVIHEIRRCSTSASQSIFIDMSSIDEEYQKMMDNDLDVGFWYEGEFYSGDPVSFEDCALPTLQISRKAPLEEDALFAAWVDEMLGRVRGLLSLGRDQAQAVLQLETSRWRVV